MSLVGQQVACLSLAGNLLSERTDKVECFPFVGDNLRRVVRPAGARLQSWFMSRANVPASQSGASEWSRLSYFSGDGEYLAIE